MKICAWRYLENTRNYPGFNLSSDPEGYRFLRERLTAGYSKTSISLNTVDKAVLSVPNNSHQQNHSFRKLRFFTASPDSSEDFLQFKEFEDELHVTLSNSQLKVVLDGLTDVKRGGGDYCICDNNGAGLWLWWL